ncbi:MAG: hypothetical protein ACM30F_03950 [Nitrospirota bacterium]|nr:hypothetical protein [Nitrospirota bacterium]
MYSVLRGLVAIYEGNRESLSSHMVKASAACHFSRTRRVVATAVERDDVDLVTIINCERCIN